jgi:hypothetical protein
MHPKFVECAKACGCGWALETSALTTRPLRSDIERLAALVAIDLNGAEGLLQEVELYLEKAFSYLEKASVAFVLGHLWSA